MDRTRSTSDAIPEFEQVSGHVVENKADEGRGAQDQQSDTSDAPDANTPAEPTLSPRPDMRGA